MWDSGSEEECAFYRKGLNNPHAAAMWDSGSKGIRVLIERT